ncbi:hypothetical protein ACA910_021832 [Epithemia clementina (nom. ined.)]
MVATGGSAAPSLHFAPSKGKNKKARRTSTKKTKTTSYSKKKQVVKHQLPPTEAPLPPPQSQTQSHNQAVLPPVHMLPSPYHVLGTSFTLSQFCTDVLKSVAALSKHSVATLPQFCKKAVIVVAVLEQVTVISDRDTPEARRLYDEIMALVRKHPLYPYHRAKVYHLRRYYACRSRTSQFPTPAGPHNSQSMPHTVAP